MTPDEIIDYARKALALLPADTETYLKVGVLNSVIGACSIPLMPATTEPILPQGPPPPQP